MCKKTFILTDKIEFVPDKDLERELNFNLRARGYIFNKTLEASIYRENFVKEFAIGKKWKVDRTYTQEIVKNLKKQKPFLKKAESTCLQASTDRLIKAYNGFYDHRTGRPKFKSLKKNPVKSITLRNNRYPTLEGIKWSLRWEGNQFRLNKLGYVKVKHKRNIDGKIKEAIIIKENGRWFLCIVYELEQIKPQGVFEGIGLYVGLYVGITDFLTFSNGKVISKPDFKKINAKIIQYRQKLDRHKKDGSNWKKNTKKTPQMDKKEKQCSNGLLP